MKDLITLEDGTEMTILPLIKGRCIIDMVNKDMTQGISFILTQKDIELLLHKLQEKE